VRGACEAPILGFAQDREELGLGSTGGLEAIQSLGDLDQAGRAARAATGERDGGFGPVANVDERAASGDVDFALRSEEIGFEAYGGRGYLLAASSIGRSTIACSRRGRRPKAAPVGVWK
jgi:hypothetical protein